MKEIQAQQVTETVDRLCREAAQFLPQDVQSALEKAQQTEVSPVGKDILNQLLENAALARDSGIPICQDTGLTVVFVELGQDVHVTGGYLYDAINEGVRKGYVEGYLRKSVVNPPIFERANTKDNTPAAIYTDVVPGDKLTIHVLPKGAGSENMSALSMLSPSAGVEGVIKFVVDSVEKAGSNPCPPIIAGVGIGGTSERTALLAKKALLRKVGEPNPDPRIAEVEKKILEKINASGIGPQGFGGRVTAMAVHIETFPAHIACMPVAVNIQCHAARHKTAVL